MTTKPVILLADNDPIWLNDTKVFLEKTGHYSVVAATNFGETEALLIKEEFDIAIIDLRLVEETDPTDEDSMDDLTGLILAEKYAVNKPKIITTAWPTFENLRNTLRKRDVLPAGIDFVGKHENRAAFIIAIERSLNVKAGWPILAYSIFGPPNHNLQSDVFVIMPFTDELKVVYSSVIKRVGNERNLVVKRGDDSFTKKGIMDKVWSFITNCRVVIADCTGRNPNVFYELGMAQTLGKPVIMITQNINDIPFDIRQFQLIPYENTPPGRARLRRELDAVIAELLSRNFE
jgi:CheY-like chemotaxis protein